MKRFIIGLVIGVSLSSAALAVNPIANLPIQEQMDRVINSVDAQFQDISDALALAQEFFIDIDGRLTVIEKKLKIKRDE